MTSSRNDTVAAPDPVVDVGIPAYGRPTFLAEAMASVLSQTLAAWRLTVSEDGPGGGEVARIVHPFLSDARVRYVATGERAGAAANMTALVRQGSSPYVALLHDDDRWDADFLERRVTFLEAHPECGFVFGADDTIDENGQQVGPWKRLLPEGVYPPEQFVPRLLRRNVVSPPTLLVRRAAYEAVGPAFDERFPTIYDYEMIVRLAVRFPAGYIPVCDAHWRRHGHQSSFVNYVREAEHRRFLDHVDALLARELPSVRFGSLARRRRLSGWLRYMAFNGLEQGDRRSAASQLVRSIRTYPPAGLDPRVASGFAALALGRPGRHALHIARRATRRQRERLPGR